MNRLGVSLLGLCMLAACASTGGADRSELNVKFLEVYDGDTFYVDLVGLPDVMGKRLGIRIKGIDTPEIRTKSSCEKKLGYKAKEALESLMVGARKIELLELERGKYFRLVASVKADGKDVASYLISKKLARPYDGGTKGGKWCTE